MEATIGVTGLGRLSVKPDTIQLMLNLNETKESYSQAMEASAQATDQLKAAFIPLGFEGSDLKTGLFSIDSKYESFPDDQGRYQQKFVGFEYDHRLKLEFAADKDKLGQVLTALLRSGVAATFTINYTVKDKEAAQAELLKNAVEDARKKSALLAQASGVQLGKLIHIAYGREEISFRSEAMRGARMTEYAAMSSISADIEPEDIPLEESVRLVWEIR